jgi:Mce-associated membrane protein
MAEHADTAGEELSMTSKDRVSPHSTGTAVSPSASLDDVDFESVDAPGEENVDASMAEDEDAAAETGDDCAATVATPRKRALRLALAVGSVALIGLSALVGWLGYRDSQTHQASEQRNLFLQVGRQGALNLTTIDWEHADIDVQRIQHSATGPFYDDFSKRSPAFVEVVKKAKAKSIGTITEAGMESESADEAQVLVAVSVKTSNSGAPEQEPRFWRMRITVHKTDDGVKVSNVAFVP